MAEKLGPPTCEPRFPRAHIPDLAGSEIFGHLYADLRAADSGRATCHPSGFRRVVVDSGGPVLSWWGRKW